MSTQQIDLDSSLAAQPILPSDKSSSARAEVPLGQRLIEAELLREDQLDSALSHQAAESKRAGDDEGSTKQGKPSQTAWKAFVCAKG